MNYGWLFFSFRGRIPRAVFWNFLLVSALIVVLPASLLAGNNQRTADEYILVAIVILFWPSIAIQAKRLHDRNRSAWWVLIGLVPVIGQLWLLVESGFLPGTTGKNRFGKDPLKRSRQYDSEQHIPANL